MRSLLSILTLAVITIVAGCGGAPQAGERPAAAGDGIYLTVDFAKDQTLRYKFVSSRDVNVDWGKVGSEQAAKAKVDTSAESLEMVVSYKVLETDPYGLTKIQASCESAKVTRTGGSRQRTGRDAAEMFAGKTWVFAVGPSGRIEDPCGFEAVLREAGKSAIRPDTSKGAIKDQDMLYDITASQHFLFDPVASRKEAAKPAKIGEEWKSVLSVPAPMILWVARDTTYRLDEIRGEAGGRVAVISSTYALTKEVPLNWPIPYTTPFMMSSTFGFLRNYQPQSLSGRGEELFNLDAGRTEKRTQKYQMEMSASLPLPMPVNPKITIDQTMTMELLPTETPAK